MNVILTAQASLDVKERFGLSVQELDELIRLNQSYLKLSSIDGKTERQPLRARMEELVSKARTGCLNDTDGDGDCHLCAKVGGCMENV